MQNNGKDFKKTVADWVYLTRGTSEDSKNRVLRFEDVYDLMKEGIAHFWFRKKDGSLRNAYGTLVMEIIDRHGGIPEGAERNARPFHGNVSYFDLEKDAWRCFKADSVQEIDFHYGMLI